MRSTSGIVFSQLLADVSETGNDLVRWLDWCDGRWNAQVKAFVSKIDRLRAVLLSTCQVARVCTSRLVDFVIPDEEPDREKQQHLELFIVCFGPPCSGKEGEV
jgi:hypothetical protein